MWVLIVIVVCTIAGALIGRTKGRETFGVAMGLLLGPIGVIVIALMPPNKVEMDRLETKSGKKKCARCAEWVQSEAKVCRYCGAEMS